MFFSGLPRVYDKSSRARLSTKPSLSFTTHLLRHLLRLQPAPSQRHPQGDFSSYPISPSPTAEIHLNQTTREATGDEESRQQVDSTRGLKETQPRNERVGTRLIHGAPAGPYQRREIKIQHWLITGKLHSGDCSQLWCLGQIYAGVQAEISGLGVVAIVGRCTVDNVTTPC